MTRIHNRHRARQNRRLRRDPELRRLRAEAEELRRRLAARGVAIDDLQSMIDALLETVGGLQAQVEALTPAATRAPSSA